MTDERELDDGLAAFEQLSAEIRENKVIIRTFQHELANRNRQENALSAEMQTALKQATGASQKALQASQSELRSNLLWSGFTGLLIALAGCGAGYYLGHQSGWEQGQAEGYQKARNQEAAASWANTPAGQRAYGLDRRGDLDLLALCRGDGWTTEHRKGGTVCFPKADAKGNVTGWYLP